MSSRLGLWLASLWFFAGLLTAQSPLLVRDSAVASAQTPQGPVAVQVSPITSANDITVVVLSDTLQAGDPDRIRRDLSSALTSALLTSHPIRVIDVVGAAGDVSTPLKTRSQLQVALNRLAMPGTPSTASPADLTAVLASVAASAGSDWARVLVVGRFPEAQADTEWIAVWIGDAYRKQRLRVSFWSLDGAPPTWTEIVSAATLGLVAKDDLSPVIADLSDVAPLFEASWKSKLPAGSWIYAADLKNAAGTTVRGAGTLTSADGFALPFGQYIAARAIMRQSPPEDRDSAEKVLTLNPADVDALRRLAPLAAAKQQFRDSAQLWNRLVQVLPQDGAAWAGLASASYNAEDYEFAGRATKQARLSGMKTHGILSLDAKLSFRRRDFEGALAQTEEALVDSKDDQELWLLRADCGNRLNRWAIESESLEHAAALGPVPLDRRTRLISIYLEHNRAARAIPHLTAATAVLPRDAAVAVQYADFWEQEHDTANAEHLWQSALAIDANDQPAHLGLARHYLAAGRPKDAVEAANSGLALSPKSVPLLLAKERALEASGDIYPARRLLDDQAPASKNVDLVRRWAWLEDRFGSSAPEAYLALLNILPANEENKPELIDASRRGLLASLRNEDMDDARQFASRLVSFGEKDVLSLLGSGSAAGDNSAEILGGSDAFHFLLFGKGKTNPADVLSDCSRALCSLQTKKAFEQTTQLVHNYFEELSALAALGSRKKDRVEIILSLKNKPEKQRTEKVFELLGLKLKRNKGALTVESTLGKAQAKKQDTLAALAIDDQGIQEALAAGRPYTLEIPIDTVSVFPGMNLWRTSFPERTQSAGGIAEMLSSDPRLAQLYLALNSMDRAAAEMLVRRISLRIVADKYGSALSLFSAALAVGDGRVEVPGGVPASAVWQQFTGVSPADPVSFFEALLSRDEGRLIAFFYTLAQLDFEHQRFFTRSPERAKRFYDLFRESPEMRKGGEHRVFSSAFMDFVREVPLNDDGSVDFAGGPEVWMVAKGHSNSGQSVAKISRKMKRVTPPDDEDEILVRLAKTGYKSASGAQSELSNFVAVTRVDAERDQPLSLEEALLLAQNYSTFGGLYNYFTGLGDLSAADYQALFALSTKIQQYESVTANLRFGELHSFLELQCLARQSGLAAPEDLLKLFRTGLERYTQAVDASNWTTASLNAVEDLVSLTRPAKFNSSDAALRALILGACAGHSRDCVSGRDKAFQRILELQKVPPLEALLNIRESLKKLPAAPAAIDNIQKQLSLLVVLEPPKGWHAEPFQRRIAERYKSDGQATLSRLREKLAKRKRNPADIEKLSMELLGELEPWTELAMAGQVYARFLDPSDLVVAEDPFLLRKHEFFEIGIAGGRRDWLTHADLEISNEGQGSYFKGGFAEFSLAAGRARAAGNHIGGGTGQSFAAAVFASVTATDWRSLTEPALLCFGTTVRVAREWIVQSASSQGMRMVVAKESIGLLSLTRRKQLLEATANRDWPGVWRAVSVGDLYFLGAALIQHAPKDLWSDPVLVAMKEAAVKGGNLDVLGQVAPSIGGASTPRLRRYLPYEEYQRQYLPDRIAQRAAELKLYLASMADSGAWPPQTVAETAGAAADAVMKKLEMRDMWDWSAALASYRNLSADTVKSLLDQQ